MLCPRCKQVLRMRMIHNVEVDRCLACDGVWFDQGELQAAREKVEPDSRWMDVDLWADPDRFKVLDGELACPRCHAEMATIAYGDTGVEIDYCPQCQGAWLDGGEFEKIVNALREEIASKGAPDYLAASLEEAKEVVDGEKGLASEWRDLAVVTRLLQYRLLAERPGLRSVLEVLRRGSTNL
ncbi:MAG: zf-TFIIB domain-containing protein [Anaerolineae bacterium]|nr:zf-TFIIB domain-containing protein [Anaerolineae bacterium]